MSTPFILRPIATTLLIVAIVLLGIIGYRFLPVAALPSVDFPTIQVTTSFPGAGPDVVETSITAPLEHQFGQIAGLTSMNSTSSYGTSQITLQFALSRKMDSAAQDVQAKINAAEGWLPLSLLPNPPIYHEVNPADTPVLILALTSETLPLHEINDFAATVIVQKLSQVSGVGAVTVEGGQTRAVRIQANPAQLANLGLSMEDVRRAIAATTVDNPKGGLDGERQAFQIGTNDQLFLAENYDTAVIAFRNGAPVLLRDVGRAVDGVENAELAGWFNGERAVILDIQRQPGANTIEVVDAIKALLPKLKTALPPSLKIQVVTDRTVTIRAAIADVQFTLVLTVVLVVLVIFLFLRKLWATVIPSITLPVSLIATFGGMALVGFSLDNLSLMALTIASGFVVDDAIVMIENIVRHIEAGEKPIPAAIKGARQIGFTVISLTVSLIAVFIPLLLMGGVVGRLFREFAITLSFAVLISGVVSLTLTPMMCAKLLKPHNEERPPGRFFRWSERGFDLMAGGHRRILDFVLRHQPATLVFTLLTLVVTGWLYVAIHKGFLPQQDTGLLVGVTDAPQDISFTAMAQRQSELAEIIAKDPAVRGVDSFVGAGTVNPTLNSGRLYIDIGSPEGRTAAPEVMERLYKAVAGLHGITLHLQQVQDIQIETRTSRTQYQYVLQDLDDAELRLWTPRLVAELARQPELADVASDQLDEGLRMMVTIDRKAAARFGVTLNAIDNTLYDAFGQRQIATIFSPLTQYHVILEVDPAFKNDPNILDKIYVTPASAQAASVDDQGGGIGSAFHQASVPIPLSAVAKIERTLAPLSITHQGLFPATTVSFNLAPGASLGQAIEAERKEGMAPEQSIREACLLRFRPIMMTTMAALLGALPLAIGDGTGAELRRPMGVAIVGGLLLSQFLTLYTTPVIYLAFARLQARFARRHGATALPAPLAEAPGQ